MGLKLGVWVTLKYVQRTERGQILLTHFIYFAFEMNTYVTYLFDSPPQDLNPSTVFFNMMKRLNFITGPVFLEDETSPWTFIYFKD